MVDYNTLVGAETLPGSIKYGINYARIDAAGILSEAQAWIYMRVRLAEMKSIADIPIALNDTSVALPTGYLDPIHFGIPGTMQTIRYADPERFRTLLGWDGGSPSVLPVQPPSRWAMFDGRIQLNCQSDAAYTGRMTYYKQPSDLTTLAPTNFLTTRYPSLLRRVCLMFAAEARKEWDTVNSNEVKALEMIDTIKVQDDLSNRGMEMDFNWEESY